VKTYEVSEQIKTDRQMALDLLTARIAAAETVVQVFHQRRFGPIQGGDQFERTYDSALKFLAANFELSLLLKKRSAIDTEEAGTHV